MKAIVVACNTASALALDTIRPEIDLPIIGVVRPGTEMALKATHNKRIGVIATDSTIRSNLYQTLLREHDKEVRVFAQACPLFVPLVEEGWTKDPVTRALRRLLDDHGLLNDGRHQVTPQYDFYASDTVEKFNAFANSILPYEIGSTTQVQIEKY